MALHEHEEHGHEGHDHHHGHDHEHDEHKHDHEHEGHDHHHEHDDHEHDDHDHAHSHEGRHHHEHDDHDHEGHDHHHEHDDHDHHDHAHSHAGHHHHDHDDHDHDEEEHEDISIDYHEESVIAVFQKSLSRPYAEVVDIVEGRMRIIGDAVTAKGGFIGHIKSVVIAEGERCMLSVTDVGAPAQRRDLGGESARFELVCIVLLIEGDDLRAIIKDAFKDYIG